jgi:ferredoxin
MIKKLKPSKTNDFRGLVLKNDFTIENIIITNQGKNYVETDVNTRSATACVNCDEKYCFQFESERIETDILEGFPYNNDKRVCPSNAVDANGVDGPTIDAEACIGCGLCVHRCIYGGITFNNETGEVKVVKENTGIYEDISDVNDRRRITTKDVFKDLSKISEIERITVEETSRLQSGFRKSSIRNGDVELILLRNYLLILGVSNKVAAKGNVDTRIDLLGLMDRKVLPGESELLGSDTLGLPRRILEDYAILHSRHKIEKQNILPLLFIATFPRKRSDFYEVITDIEIVTGLKIKTIPLHLLYLHMWFNKKLTLEGLDSLQTINKTNLTLMNLVDAGFPDLEEIDENFGNELYTFLK